MHSCVPHSLILDGAEMRRARETLHATVIIQHHEDRRDVRRSAIYIAHACIIELAIVIPHRQT